MAEYVVLAAGQDSKIIADHLGLPLADKPSGIGGPGMVVMATTPTDVINISRVIDRGHPIVCVIAWRLSEGNLGRLLELRVPVFIGMPGKERFFEAMEAGRDTLDRNEERSRSSQYSVIENLLERPKST